LAKESIISINLTEFGIKEGEEGKFEISDDQVDKAFSDKIYIDIKEYSKAESLYLKIIDIDPLYMNAYFNLLNDYIIMNDFNKFHKVIDLMQNNISDEILLSDLLYEYALKLYDNNLIKESIILFETILDNYPVKSEARSDYGTVLLKSGKLQMGLDLFKAVYKSNPDDKINLHNYYYASILNEDFQ